MSPGPGSQACPKPLPHQITKAARKAEKIATERTFRQAVWTRDDGRSRATGRSLVRSGTMDWHRLGEVDHAVPRSLAPDRLYDISNGILLSKWENRMRKVPCRLAPEHRYFDFSGPDDRSEPQTFVWRDDEGRITKTRIG